MNHNGDLHVGVIEGLLHLEEGKFAQLRWVFTWSGVQDYTGATKRRTLSIQLNKGSGLLGSIMGLISWWVDHQEPQRWSEAFIHHTSLKPSFEHLLNPKARCVPH